jgi:uncharacterized protein YcbK (DUF882 family)
MNLLQSIAGQATSAVERLTATLAPKAEPKAEAGAVAKGFAATLALALDPKAATAAEAGATAEEGEEGETVAGAGVDASLLAALAGAPDPATVQRSLDLLDPEFESKLKRVIERMESEFGHKVQVTETFRSQERQNFLYEQGRSRAGNVVTWTRASNHTLGRAADVLIDGSYDNPKGYARLAEIAAEEGLRTLGPRDPGHVELPGSSRGRSTPAATFAQATAAETQPKWEPKLEVAPQPARQVGLARVAEVARVADVAQVAQVASVARVATVANPAAPGMQGATVLAARSARTRDVDAGSARTLDAVQALHQAMGNHQGIAALRSELGRAFTGEGGSGSGEGERSSQDSGVFRGEGSLLPRGTFQNAVNEVLATSGTNGAERAARILELQDGAAAGPMSHVMLRVDNPSGGEDRIRIDLRGSSVDARIDMSNVGEAERVTARLGELRSTLERHGLEAESLRVRSTSAINQADAIEMPRLGLALSEAEASRGAAGSRSGSSNPDSSREEWKDTAQGQARRDPSDPRQRPRRPTPEKETA